MVKGVLVAAPSGPRKIVVDSLDMDGCVFHEHYLRTIQDNSRGLGPYREGIADNNADLINFLKATSSDAQHILILGTNRQDFGTDRLNSCRGGSHTISGPNALMQIASKLTASGHPCTVDRFMMTEVKDTGLATGGTFEAILSCDRSYLTAASAAASPTATAAEARNAHYPSTPAETAEATFDASKITLLYAQMHKIASENPDAQIVYRFHDDRPEILQGLRSVFAARPDLIPSNVTLECYAYDGAPPTLAERIPGTGTRDPSYRATVTTMAKNSKLSEIRDPPTPQGVREELIPHLPGSLHSALTKKSEAGASLDKYAYAEYRRIHRDNEKKGLQFLQLTVDLSYALHNSKEALESQMLTFLHRLKTIAYRDKDGKYSEESQSAVNFKAFITNPEIASFFENITLVKTPAGHFTYSGSMLPGSSEKSTVCPRDGHEERLFSAINSRHTLMSQVDFAALLRDKHPRGSFLFHSGTSGGGTAAAPSPT